jgi:hypothetical protein
MFAMQKFGNFIQCKIYKGSLLLGNTSASDVFRTLFDQVAPLINMGEAKHILLFIPFKYMLPSHGCSEGQNIIIIAIKNLNHAVTVSR